MTFKDKIFSWFVKNIIMSKMEEISNSGFIITRVSPLGDVYLRDLFIPENLLVLVENSCRICSDNKFINLLYLTGKKFVFNYSKLSNFPTSKEKNFSMFANFFVKYIEGTYAKKITHEIDIKNKFLKLNCDNYIVCSKNGLGYIFSCGSIAGVWSYAFQDLNIEAVQPKCQGRGDKECLVIAAPYETLVKMGYKPIRCEEIEKNHKENNING